MSRKPLSFHEIQSESGLVIGSGSKAAGHRSRQREFDVGKGQKPVAAFTRVGAGWSLVSWQLVGPCLRLRKGPPPAQRSFVPSVNCVCLEVGLDNRRVWFRRSIETWRRAKIRSLRLCLHEGRVATIRARWRRPNSRKEGSK